MSISTVRAKFKKFITIMNQPRRGHKAILSAAIVRRMVREVNTSPKTTVSEWYNYSLVASCGHHVTNPPKDVTSITTTKKNLPFYTGRKLVYFHLKSPR